MSNSLPSSHAHDAEPLGHQAPEWHGDHLIENPDASWSLATDFPISVGDLWDGPRGITRIGPSDEGYAGYMLPSKLHGLVEGTNFAYLLPPPLEQEAATPPKQLEVGASITDGNGSEKLTVVDLDNDSRRMTFEATWKRADTGKPDLHYTWEIRALEAEEPNTSQLLTKMRIEGLSQPKLWEKVGPAADRFTMNLVRQGIVGENPDPLSTKRKLGTAALVSGAAALGVVAAKKRLK